MSHYWDAASCHLHVCITLHTPPPPAWPPSAPWGSRHGRRVRESGTPGRDGRPTRTRSTSIKQNKRKRRKDLSGQHNAVPGCPMEGCMVALAALTMGSSKLQLQTITCAYGMGLGTIAAEDAGDDLMLMSGAACLGGPGRQPAPVERQAQCTHILLHDPCNSHRGSCCREPKARLGGSAPLFYCEWRGAGWGAGGEGDTNATHTRTTSSSPHKSITGPSGAVGARVLRATPVCTGRAAWGQAGGLPTAAWTGCTGPAQAALPAGCPLAGVDAVAAPLPAA
jgi:hypothetical protein